MKSYKIKLQPKATPEYITIIYEDLHRQLYKITSPIDTFLESLQYFQKRSKEIHEMKSIYIHEHIPFDLFENFINSTYTKEIDIDENNYKTYNYLSQKYQFNDLYDQIQEFIKQRPDINSMIDDITNQTVLTVTTENNEKFDFFKEELIAKNLDAGLQNGNMHKIPLKKLNRILNSPKRVINDHHLLFSFVISMIKMKMSEELELEERENLLLLPGCLDYCEMTHEEIEELFQTENSIEFFQPRHSREKIELLISNEQKLLGKIDDLEKQIKRNEDFFKQEIDKTNAKVQETNAKVQETDTKVQETNTKVHDLNKKVQETDTKVHDLDTKVDETNNFLFESIKRIEKVEAFMGDSAKKDESFESRIMSVEANENEQNFRIKKTEKVIEILDLKLSSIEDPKFQVQSCPDGIFYYLFDKYKSNPANIGVIKIEGNSYDDLWAKRLPNIIDSNWKNNYWHSKYVENSFIKIDFNKLLVKINKYKLTLGTKSGDFYINSWTLKGVTESKQEVVLDDVNNSSEITKFNTEITVNIGDKPFVSSIKLIAQGKSNNDTTPYVLVLKNIEFFGYIKESI